MGLKKRLSSIAEAVEGILGDPVKAKKLKKIKALESFIAKMEAKGAELGAELEVVELDAESRELKQRHLETLDKQMSKARKLLKEMKEKSK